MFIEAIKRFFLNNNYIFIDNGLPYQLNTFAIRSSNRITGHFNDYFYVVYKDSYDKWRINQWLCCTDSVQYFADDLSACEGRISLLPGQYLDSYATGKLANKYQALAQVKPVLGIKIIEREEVEGHFGAHIFSGEKAIIDNVLWPSAGIAFARQNDFSEFMRIVLIASAQFGNNFDFTLFAE